MLVVAGAGTGKTTVLTQRIVALVEGGHCRPQEVLAITFTDEAAKAMARKLNMLRPGLGEQVRVCTFHAYCQGVLEANGRGFKVIPKEDLWVFLRRRLDALPLRRFLKPQDPAAVLGALLTFFDRCLDELVSASRYREYIQKVEAGEFPLPRVSSAKEAEKLTRDDILERCREIAGVFEAVEQMLTEKNLGTFGHQISRAVQLLKDDPQALARARAEVKFLLVDEFQDCNTAQILLSELLTKPEGNIFAVGDPDQAIYRFRGASSGAFAEFLERFPKAELVALTSNQRSVQNVLDCAFAVLSKNPQPLQAVEGCNFQREKLRSARAQREDGEAERVTVALCLDHEAEATAVVESICARQQESGCAWREFAVLTRNHVHRDLVLRELIARMVPFNVASGSVLETGAVRDALAVLRCLRSMEDSVSLFRLALMPAWGMDPAFLRDTLERAERPNTLAGVLAEVDAARPLLETITRLRHSAKIETAPALAAFDSAARAFHLPRNPEVTALRDFIAKWQENPTTESGTLHEFLDYLELFLQAGGKITLEATPEDGVWLMTVHRAKGLEFRHVYVLRAESASFPTHFKAALFEFPEGLVDSAVELKEGKEQHREEERRMFYVAMTRARDTLMLCGRDHPAKSGTPYRSAFVEELCKSDAKHAFRLGSETRIALAARAEDEGSGWTALPPRDAWRNEPLSASAIDTYTDCPLQLKLKREWRLPVPVSPQVEFGNAVHRVLLHHYKALQQGREVPVETSVAMLVEELQDSVMPERQRKLYQEHGAERLRAMLSSPQAQPLGEIVEVERPFEVQVCGIALKGRTDRVDMLESKRVAVVDYKTGSPWDQKKADDSLQLSVYAAALTMRGYVVDRIVVHNLEDNTVVVTRPDEKRMTRAESVILAASSGIAAGRFEPSPGYHCRWCDYRKLCPATEQRLYGIEAAAAAETKQKGTP